MSDNNSQGIRNLNEKERLVVLALNVLLALGVFFISTGELIPSGTGASIWLLAATSYWFLVLLGTPFFTPPKDSLTTAVVVVLLLLPLEFVETLNFGTSLAILKWTGIALALIVAGLAIAAIVKRETVTGKVFFHLTKFFGRGELLFTPVIIITALAYYQDTVGWMYWILAFWTIMLTVKPVEVAYRAYLYLTESFRNELSKESERIGTVIRIDDPNIVRVVLKKEATWDLNKVHAVHMPDGTSKPLLPLFKQIQNEEVIGTGLLCETKINVPNSVSGGVYEVVKPDENYLETLTASLSGDGAATKVAGIVVENSSISSIKFQVVNNTPLKEGTVVFAFMDDKKVFYQILDATTSEENFQQNPYGTHIVTALQLGSYVPADGFKKYPWLPMMNQPLFLAPESEERMTAELSEGEFVIGGVPSTPYGVPVLLKDLVEHHTAILGMTGTAKTELAFEIIREALKQGTKVFCVDFTGEYINRLSDCSPQAIGLERAQGEQLEKLLFDVETGEFKASAEKKALNDFMLKVKPEIESQVTEFIESEEVSLGIFELADIANTKASLRITELYLSAIMQWARSHRKAKSIMIVLEEAHTIIPESSFGFDAETKWVVDRIGQIALQGRKYGVGLMLISQRTALVSKTVLSQCHTYFVHALADKTSLEYLSSILTPEHVKAIPNLKFLEFIVHGKALKSERPLLAYRPHDKAKADASAALNVTLEKRVEDMTAEELAELF